MHWPNYRALVAHLKMLPPEEFNYGDQFGRNNCGCVAWHTHKYLGQTSSERGGTISVIQDFLGVTTNEAIYLFGPGGDHCGDVEPDAVQFWANNPSATGTPGLREALRRLSVVAERHGGDPEERAWLERVKVGVMAPLPEEATCLS